ncbi:hypothetical protein AMELA_G00034720 [Ameiurus melas]|uniref:Uncharacterized protein n=1 Tax=Ameiurus melas TaxID=219545 RepID=A0A7J6BB24_AMEME|nr:hypothetical protein AMELA_G00034720 [Ameiurus melas]
MNISAQLHTLKSYLKPHIVYLQYLREHVLIALHFFLQTLLRFNLFSMHTFLKYEHVNFEAYSKSVCLPKPLYSVLAHRKFSTTIPWSTWASSIRFLLLRLIWYDKSGSLFPLNGMSCKSYV